MFKVFIWFFASEVINSCMGPRPSFYAFSFLSSLAGLQVLTFCEVFNAFIMADHVRPAVDFKTAVLPLPDDQKPYDDVDMPRDIQAIMWHYGVRKPEIAACIAEGYGSKADFQFADPYATDAESKLMFKAIADRIKGKLPLRKLKGAISRILSDDPHAAIEPSEPAAEDHSSKKRKRDKSPAKNDDAPAAVAAGASDVAKSTKTSKSKSSSKSKFKDDSSDSSSNDSSNSDSDDDDDVGDDSKESSSKASSSKSKSLDSLFNSVANQVSSFGVSDSYNCLSCFILWAVVFSSHINIFACPCITCFVIFRESAVVGRSLSKHATPIRR